MFLGIFWKNLTGKLRVFWHALTFNLVYIGSEETLREILIMVDQKEIRDVIKRSKAETLWVAMGFNSRKSALILFNYL